MKAMIVNRVGDLGLLLAMFVCYYTFKSIDFSTMFSLTPYMLEETIDILGYSINSITAISLLLFVGAVGKSAQLGLHT
jgi:NADH-quinone oxidoreductase subunit L